jgi:hypothetical protein
MASLSGRSNMAGRYLSAFVFYPFIMVFAKILDDDLRPFSPSLICSSQLR